MRHVRPQMIKWAVIRPTRNFPSRRVPDSLTTYWPANSRDEPAVADAEENAAMSVKFVLPLLGGVSGAGA